MRNRRAADFQLRLGIRRGRDGRPRLVCHGLLRPTMLLRLCRWSPVRPCWLPGTADSIRLSPMSAWRWSHACQACDGAPS